VLGIGDQLVEQDGVVGVVLGPQEEDELVEQIEGLDEEERQGKLRPLAEYLAVAPQEVAQ
jgi:hypothetical protein